MICHLKSMVYTANITSWNRNLSRARALGMGGEFKRKGIQVGLGPVVSPLGRTVTSGRNWEGMSFAALFSLPASLKFYIPLGISADPYLSGALVFETVQGVQTAGVITSTKACRYSQFHHSMANNPFSILSPTNKSHIACQTEVFNQYPPILMIRLCMSCIFGTQYVPAAKHI